MPDPAADTPPLRPVRDFVSDGCALGGCLSPLLWLLIVLTAYGMRVPAQENNWVWTGAYGLPLALLGGAYLAARRRRPAFARGIGFSALVMIALFLGALVRCFPHPYG